MAGCGGAALLPGVAGESQLVDYVVGELKSQGVFDQLRKECLADVDTKPAYQNLRQRVEGAVAAFLAATAWTPDLNKNQLREKLRKHINDSNFLDQGVERIVDQVVNPKISTVFIPQVEEIVSKCLGLTKPSEASKNQNGTHETEIKQEAPENLLPNDLESVSPDSEKSHNKSADTSSENVKTPPLRDIIKLNEELKPEASTFKPSVVSDDSEISNEEEFESPAFEPLETNFKEDNSKDSNVSVAGDDAVKTEKETFTDPNSNSQSQISNDSNDRACDTKSDFKDVIDHEKSFDSEHMDVAISHKSFKFSNDDNSTDARQCFEESTDNLHVDKIKRSVAIASDNCVDETFYKTKTEVNPDLEPKTPTDYKMVTETSVDSTESNSVFVDSKNASEYNKEPLSFENKISAFDRDIESSDSSLKTDASKENTEDVMMKSPDSKHVPKDGESRRSSKERHSHSSKDKKDDARHHSSKSSHSRHSSSARRDSDRRHSSSYDRKDSKSDRHHRDSHSDSKDKHKHRKLSGDESKDRHGSSSHRSSSSHKSSRHDDKYKHSDRRSSHSHHDSKDKSKSDGGRDRSSHSNDRRKSTSHSSSKDKPRSDKSSKSSKDDSADDRKSKSKSKDECSTSGKINNKKNRRSSDRDSNDGTDGLAKGSGSYNAGNSHSINKSKSSNGESGSNGNCSSGQSDSAPNDQVQVVAGSYIKSEFNMFQFGSMAAIKRHSLSEKLVKSPDALKPGDSPIKSPTPEEMSPMSPPVKSPEIPTTKPVHIESQLNPQPQIQLITESVIPLLKKPKCASNIYEARKIMKVRKQMERMERQKKEEALSMMEKEQNIPKSSSQIYSGLSGPELKIPCVRLENMDFSMVNGYPKVESKFNFFSTKEDERLAHKLQSLQRIIKRLERLCPNDDTQSGKLISKKNGFKNTMEKPPTVDSDPETLQNGIEEAENFELDMTLDRKNIMEIILGEEMNLDDTMVYYKHTPLTAIKLSGDVSPMPNKQLKRKRASVSGSSGSDNTCENIVHNNNIEQPVEPIKLRKSSRRMINLKCSDDANKDAPGSPDSDKSIENHVNKNVENSQKTYKNIKTDICVNLKSKKSPVVPRRTRLSNCMKESVHKTKYLQSKTAKI